MIQFSNILVPTDFSENSLGALKYAAFVAKAFNAKLHVLHVLETYEFNTTLKNLGVSYEEVVQQGIQQKLEELQSREATLQGLEMETHLRKGKVHRVVSNMVEENNIDLVVMGTHGASGLGDLEKYVLGSNAYRTVHTSKVPVLTIRDPKRIRPIERILLPVDITKSTTQKVGMAIEWAKKFDARIDVIAVTEFLDDFNPQIDRVPEELEAVEAAITKAGVDCQVASIKYKDVVNGVIEYGEQVRADLMVIMTRQENLLNELVLGSHARKVISESPIPVLSVRPGKKQ